MSRKTKTEQQKAIWERFPDNRVYLANYILTLLAEKKDNLVWRKKVFSELEMAKGKDPDNALYNYISTGLLLKKACKAEAKGEKENKTKYSIKIKDRKLMNQAVEEYLKGTQKKYFNTYITDMLHCRFNIMGQPQNVTEHLKRIIVSFSVLFPHLGYLRNIPRSLWLYAVILQKEGKQQEALNIVAPWETYIKQITEDSNTLISVLVSAAAADIGEKEIPEIFRRAGEIKLAENAKQELENIAAPVKKFKASIREYSIDRKLLEKTGIFAGLLLPSLGKISLSDEDLAVSREIEYTAAEKSGIVFLNLLFLTGMIGGLLTVLYWRIRTKQKALLLAPTLQLVGKVFLLGIILPLTAYALISISEIVGGHESNIMYNAIGLGAQFIILFAVIPTVIFVLLRKHIQKRCLEIGIPCPAIKNSKERRIIAIITLVFLAILACGPLRLSYTGPFMIPLAIIGLVVVVVLVLYTVILFIEYLTTIFSGKQYALYYGALAKTIVPIFALAMIFMTLIIIPYLDWREADLISKDKIMYGQAKSFTHIEYRVTQRLKAAMLKALE